MKNKKTNYFLSIAVVLVTVAAVFMAANLITGVMRDHTQMIGREQLDAVSGDLNDMLGNAEISLLKVAKDVELMLSENASDDEILTYLKNTKKDLASENCINVYMGGDGWIIVPDFEPGADFSVTDRVWYQGAKRKGVGNIYVSSAYEDAVSTYLCFTVSILLNDKERVIGLDYDLLNIQESLSKVSEKTGGDTLVVEESGRIIGYSDRFFIGKKIEDVLPGYYNAFQKMISTGDKNASFTTEIDGHETVILFSAARSGWYIMSVADDQELNKNNYRMLRIYLIAILAAVAVLLIVHAVNVRLRGKEQSTYKDGLKILEEKFGELNDSLTGIAESVNHAANYDDITKSDLIDEVSEQIYTVNADVTAFKKRIEGGKIERTRTRRRRESRISLRNNRLTMIGVLLTLVRAMVLSVIITVRGIAIGGNNRMNGELSGYVYDLNEWVSKQKSVLDFFVRSIESNPERLNDYDNAVKWLDSTVSQYDDISVAYMTAPDAEHTVIMNNGWQPEPGWKVEERQWYMDTLASDAAAGFSISAPYLDEQTGEFCVTLSERVYDRTGNFLGVFGIDFYIDKLTHILSGSYTSDGYAFLADMNGRIINHPNKAYELSASGSTTLDDAGFSGVLYSDVPIFVKDYDKKNKLAVSTVDSQTGFSIICVKTWESAYGSSISNSIILVLIFGISILSVVNLIRISMTWQEKTNKMLKAAADEATRADEAKSRFLAQMSHEIRTPINAVLGMDEMILRESDEDEVRGYAMDIQSAGHSLLSIINDILDLSKIESGKLSIVTVDYELAGMLRDLINLIGFRAKDKGLDFKVEVDKDLPSFMHGDDVRIKQVITNILTNAVKYTERGTIWFRVSGEKADGVEKLKVEVEDTGIGIKEEDLSKLFSEFDRIDEEKNRKIEGTGLGMSITRNLLELMGTHLEVESVYGRGSKFFFTIDQKIVDETPIGDFDAKCVKELNSFSYNESFYAPRAQVLTIDDNEINIRVFKSLLKKTGVQITGATSGAEGIRLCEENKYDIIFIDHMMPDMDGIDTLTNMRADEKCINNETPTYILTANVVVGAKDMYMEKGFTGYLTKPINSERLESVIREAVPEELYETAPKEVKAEQKPRMIAELPVIGGIDWDYAINHLKDADLIAQTARDFIRILPGQVEKLNASYDKMNLEDEFVSYKILVHGIKSTAATIGIIPIAGMANVLEYAARDLKKEDIVAVHPVFLKLLEHYRVELAACFEEEADEENLKSVNEEDKEAIKEQLNKLKEAMEDIDVDTADPIIDDLLTYDFDENVKEKIDELKTAVVALDYEKVGALADEITEML